LFLSEPNQQWIKRFTGFRCIGLASTARSQSPAWMAKHLPRAFESLKAFGAPLLQYKVCSTFDSSPAIGSIGSALEIGIQEMRGDWSPMVVGVPHLKRYQAFGHLFAAAGATVYRLDRNPSMSRHPVTPMDEADLRQHLAKQTTLAVELVDLVQLAQANTVSIGNDGVAKPPFANAERETAPKPGPRVVLFDVMDQTSLLTIGRLIWEGRGQGLFSASSSGLQYALAAYWRHLGWIPEKPSLPDLQPVDVMAAICGSCSPVTAQQIAWAQAHGFVTHRMNIARVLDERLGEVEIEEQVKIALRAVKNGTCPLIYSATGPDDPAVTGFEQTAKSLGKTRVQAAHEVGLALAQVAKRLLLRAPQLKRLAVAGGDSAGVVTSALEIAALSVDAGLVPGAPLCRAWSDNPRFDGLQIVLKGGQMGGEDFFGRVLGARASSATAAGQSD
jgi:3-oxoisoapionate kinase